MKGGLTYAVKLADTFEIPARILKSCLDCLGTNYEEHDERLMNPKDVYRFYDLIRLNATFSKVKFVPQLDLYIDTQLDDYMEDEVIFMSLEMITKHFDYCDETRKVPIRKVVLRTRTEKTSITKASTQKFKHKKKTRVSISSNYYG